MIVTTQNAPADVEKMILGNKSDSEKSRVVSRERGQQVMYMYMYNTVYMSSLHSLSLSLSSSILSSLSSSSHSLLFPLACWGISSKVYGNKYQIWTKCWNSKYIYIRLSCYYMCMYCILIIIYKSFIIISWWSHTSKGLTML